MTMLVTCGCQTSGSPILWSLARKMFWPLSRSSVNMTIFSYFLERIESSEDTDKTFDLLFHQSDKCWRNFLSPNEREHFSGCGRFAKHPANLFSFCPKSFGFGQKAGDWALKSAVRPLEGSTGRELMFKKFLGSGLGGLVCCTRFSHTIWEYISKTNFYARYGTFPKPTAQLCGMHKSFQASWQISRTGRQWEWELLSLSQFCPL